MKKIVRLLTLALAVGIVAGTGFSISLAVADQFDDVPAGNAFHDDIDWLTDHGIASGFPDGTFDPTAPIKRQQASRWFRNYNAGFHLVTTSVNPDPGTSFEVTVDCAEDERALMGAGAITDGLDLTLADSFANETYEWLVRFDAPGNATIDPDDAQAVVLCAPGL